MLIRRDGSRSRAEFEDERGPYSGLWWESPPDPSSGFVGVLYPDGNRRPIGDIANMRSIVATYGEMAMEECNKGEGCPISWALAVIQTESHGDPNGRDAKGGVGPMQITATGLKKGHTDEELRDPALNLSIGIGLLRSIWAHGVRDVPVMASIYNAGGSIENGLYLPHPSRISPWGMSETAGHIGRVVMANNAFAELVRLGEVA